MDEIEVLGELGKGNYGSVHKVFHRPTGVTMAMKVILSSRRVASRPVTNKFDRKFG